MNAVIDVKLPAALASECGGTRHITIAVDERATVRELLDRIGQAHPRLGRRLRDEAGNLRRYVNLYVGDDECRRLEGLDTPVDGTAPVQILPSIAGG